MNEKSQLIVLIVTALFATPAAGQHCAPIIESYLSHVAIKHNHTAQALNLSLQYTKVGGSSKPKYQIYMLAYLEKNEHRVPANPPADLIDTNVVRVLHTDAITRKSDGTYEFRWQRGLNQLAKQIIDLGDLGEADKEIIGGYGTFTDRFRLAVFVPFLEDTTYSVLDSLPEDKHECNYTGARALLFQRLPYSFSIHFGLMQGCDLGAGNYYIQIHASESYDRSTIP